MTPNGAEACGKTRVKQVFLQFTRVFTCFWPSGWKGVQPDGPKHVKTRINHKNHRFARVLGASSAPLGGAFSIFLVFLRVFGHLAGRGSSRGVIFCFSSCFCVFNSSK